MVTRRQIMAALASSVIVASLPVPAFAENRKVTLQLAWLPDNGSVGEITALEKGYFAEKGLDVEILPGGPGANTIQETLSGVADIAVTYAPPLMYAADKSLPIKTFAAALQVAPLSFFSLGESEITSVADWKGKNVASDQAAAAQVKALLHHAGLSWEDVEFEVGRIPALMQGQADIVSAWPTNLTELAPVFAHAGGYNMQRIFDNGLEFQSNYYIATTATIDSDPEMLAAFLEAVDMGWDYAADHPEEAMSLVAKHNEALNQANEIAAFETALAGGFIYNEDTVEFGFGNIDAERWQRTLDLYAEIGEIRADLTAEDVFDASILALADRTKR